VRPRRRSRVARPSLRVGRLRHPATVCPDGWSPPRRRCLSRGDAEQNPAYRPTRPPYICDLHIQLVGTASIRSASAVNQLAAFIQQRTRHVSRRQRLGENSSGFSVPPIEGRAIHPPHRLVGGSTPLNRAGIVIAMTPNLAPPTGATLVDEWDNIGAAFRAFDGPEWRIKHAADHGQRADIVVSVIGLQYADGHALCKIIIDCPDTPVITSAEALKLAGALIAAAGAAEASGWA
jgi:hypothetical protein